MAHKANLKRKALAESSALAALKTKISRYSNGQSNLSEESDDEPPRNGLSVMQQKKTDIGKKLMSKMGYTEGKGLGKHEQGIVDSISASSHKGRRGLGYSLSDVNVDKEFEWSEEKERDFVSVREEVKWIDQCPKPPPKDKEMVKWTTHGPKKLTIHDETDFCDKDVVKAVINCKNVFDKLSGHELRRARSMSNPFETIEKGIFQNRAAMKMANIDSAFDFMFTNPKDEHNRPILGQEDLLYFADICAGPGGFSEYVLWRKGWEAKGFGFTLKGPLDFKLEEFYAGSAETFEPHYGENARDGDGDIYVPRNLIAFRNHVIANSDNKGVHFVMADGGFSVEGQENIQEILSKRLYLCQCLCALGILRTGGHFICKLFDLFTPFSVGLLYIMYRCFDQICIFKPNTSRPANSERFLICKSKREGLSDVENYLFKLNCHFDSIMSQNAEDSNDVTKIVPTAVIKGDQAFNSYIRQSNSFLGRRQILFLTKVKAFAENEGLFETRQHELKRESFKLWDVPLKGRVVPSRSLPQDKFRELITTSKVPALNDVTVLAYKPTILTKQLLQSSKKPLEFPRNFKCVILSGEDVSSNSLKTERGFFLIMGKNNNAFWDGCATSSWKKVDMRLALPPDTLIYAEKVQELQGEGRAQRRTGAFHIIDAMFLGGKDLRQFAFEDRILYINKLIKAVHRPTAPPDLVMIRAKQVHSLSNLDEIFSNRLDMRECKSAMNGAEKYRLCYDVDVDKFIDPCGLLIFTTVNDKYIRCLSKSSGKEYFFEKTSKKSVFDKPREAVANFNETYESRLFWRWNNENNLKEEKNERLKEADTVDRYTITRFLATKL